MLEARKNRFVEQALALYNRNLIKRRFGAINVSNLELIEKRDARIPLIFYSNHSSWWDGAIAFAVWEKLGIDCFVMMEEKQLARLGLFRRVGAFSVVRENPRETLLSINYAARLLRENDNRAIWLFPQGEILPNDARPLHFYQGISRIVEKTGECLLVPAAMRFEFLGEFKPEAFVKIGAPELISNKGNFDRKKLTAHFSERLNEALNELKEDIIERRTENYVRLF